MFDQPPTAVQFVPLDCTGLCEGAYSNLMMALNVHVILMFGLSPALLSWLHWDGAREDAAVSSQLITWRLACSLTWQTNRSARFE